MTERLNLYRLIHKAVRVQLGRLAAEAGRADFADANELARLRELAAATFSLLDDHAGHEDQHVMALVKAAAPEVHAKLDGAHRELEEISKALWRMLGVVSQAGSAAPREGHAFLLQLSRYHAAQLSHMADEEELAMPALWRAYGDDTLLQVQQKIVGSIAPEKLAGALALILPSGNATERAEMMGGIKAAAPAPAFAALMRVAQGSLDPRDYDRLERDLTRARAA